ncbi:MAG: RidA family protein [Pseudohongiellaceae bacterium]
MRQTAKLPVPFSPTRRTLLRRASLAIAGLGLWPLVVRGAESPATRLGALGITLPETPPPLANYVPYLVQENFVYIAGQIPMRDGELLHPGAVPTAVSVEQAREAARQCGVNILAALNAACAGDLNRVRQCMRLDGFVASGDGFTGQATVMNAASDLMVEVFGDTGRHTRTAVGVNQLPGNACVEIAAVFVID